jgi:hypothetical protein
MGIGGMWIGNELQNMYQRTNRECNMENRKYAAGIYLHNRLITSRAFTELARRRNGGVAIHILHYFYLKRVFAKPPGKPGKRQERIPINARELQFTYVEAEGLGFTTGRFERALDLLFEYGFLDIESTGMGLYQMATVYGISERWKKWPNIEKVKRPKSTQYNVGFQPGNDLWKRRKKKTTVTGEHGAMRTSEHGEGVREIVVMRTSEHGEKLQTIYKLNNRRWIARKIA